MFAERRDAHGGTVLSRPVPRGSSVAVTVERTGGAPQIGRTDPLFRTVGAA